MPSSFVKFDSSRSLNSKPKIHSYGFSIENSVFLDKKRISWLKVSLFLNVSEK